MEQLRKLREPARVKAEAKAKAAPAPEGRFVKFRVLPKAEEDKPVFQDFAVLRQVWAFVISPSCVLLTGLKISGLAWGGVLLGPRDQLGLIGP
jgi:hypothetical protein